VAHTDSERTPPELLNFIAGAWHRPSDAGRSPVHDPASGEVLSQVVLSPADEVDRVVGAGLAAFPAWHEMPANVLPDADMTMTSRILADSAFGCAGQRCLATSVAITVGEARDELTQRICDDALARRVGHGLEDGVQMGPVISSAARERVEGLIERGAAEEARRLVDGRGRAHGNQARLFTSSGAAARTFCHRVRAGNVGINLGVAAPMAFFPFSGWGDSLFGDLHAQAGHGFEFYSQTEVVIEGWPTTWSRRF